MNPALTLPNPPITPHILHLLILKPLLTITSLPHPGRNTSSSRNTGSLRRKRRARQPLDRILRLLDFGVQLVDLFECEAFGLVDEEVDEGDAEEAAGEPDEEDFGLQVGVAAAVVDEVGG